MLVTIYCAEILGALSLGAFSAFVLDRYSLFIARTQNPWLRFVVWLAIGVPLIVGLPVAACLYMLGISPLPADKTVRTFWMLLVFLCWAAVMYGYIIRHWHTLMRRLNGPRRI